MKNFLRRFFIDVVNFIKNCSFVTTMSISPLETITVEKWLPSSEVLHQSIIYILGYKGTGKSTVANALQSPNATMAQSFCNISPSNRGEIDFLILCGVPSRRDVERIYDRYQHLFTISANQLYEITQTVIQNYTCLVIDISLPVRLGNEKAKIYSYRANKN